MRYQRHVENYYLRHAKEVVEMLDRVVREEAVEHIILAGDQVIIPLLREQLPDHLKEKIIDILRLDIRAPEHEVLKATMEAVSEHNLHTDAEKVRRFLDEYRAGGLAVVAVRDTMQALEQGQVDELLISASQSEVRLEEDFDMSPQDHNSSGKRFSSGMTTADLLLTRARQTGARVTFIEDAALLRSVGGVGAMLRYQVD